MKIKLYLFIVPILFFCSCIGTKNIVNEKPLDFTEEELPEVLKGTLQLPELMSPKEKLMAQKLYQIHLYHVVVDTIREKIRLDLSPEICAELGLPASTENILKKEFRKEMKLTKKMGKKYYKWYLSITARSIAAERLKKKEGAIFFEPIFNERPPQ